ncbi:Protein kinase domain-containing protein ppk32 [Recurvomyces mirabilis]|uniref:Protein kinase domain-containing protein ppk32 n=1 Tax=Recurvomyces mirabilis TaxID=574656 RepID=A0AAE0TSH9_9PEZI|nr:Protein kinase domain-containing protein ppk32 [Recurvomyces mirabilis]KAK5160121.1 Protein kinase domain-containing protein ppk32 [Recurvomyces mirabilis]
MFSKALSSFTSNITSNYTLSNQPTSTAGPWKIFDAKRKATGKAASVFVFDPKTLVPQGGSLGGRGGGAASLKRAHEEVVERLRREASSLARLRHPSILELQEPVEETRNGGVMFATEAVTASLAGILQEKDEQERGVGQGRGSRFVVEDPTDGTRRRRELEIDELEIQKGLLQLGKGLEFLHESAGLVHANLTPDAVLINAKGDWKISGLAFCGSHETSTSATATTMPAINLHEVLTHDPRLPQIVQLNLDYTSPDFVLDNHLTPSADIFSLGLIILALYNTPHNSPLNTGNSLSTYKRLFASSTSIPTQHNNYLIPSSAQPLPPRLATELLPRLITRRPAQRLTAREFQEASYFDNILVSTIRFLDALPAKTTAEKLAFLRGLPRIMPQFPKSVLEKKVLPALLEEMKDRALLAPILTNVFALVKVMPTGKRAFGGVVGPKLREVFVGSHPSVTAKAGRESEQSDKERDTTKDPALMVLLENMSLAVSNSTGKEFRDDLLPIFLLALDSPTHGLVDAALSMLGTVLPVLDFSTIKHEVFPVIAAGFARTSSLAIKVRGLEAFGVLCGGGVGAGALGEGDDDWGGDDLDGIAILDKFTIQEKIVPLLKGIKTKEPGVMMAALRVFRQVGEVADMEFLAMEVLPQLWSMSLGPLLNLEQFQAFMGLIRRIGGRIERERVEGLRGMGGSASGGVGVGGGGVRRGGKGGVQGGVGGMNGMEAGVGEEQDFESLVSGRSKTVAKAGGDDLMDGFGGVGPTIQPTSGAVRTASSTLQSRANDTPTFSWQSQSSVPATQAQARSTRNDFPPPAASRSMASLQPQQQQRQTSRTITPDQSLSSFGALTPQSQFSQPLQPSRTGGTGGMPLRPSITQQQPPPHPASGGSGGVGGIDWSAAKNDTATNWSAQRPPSSNAAGFALPPPPLSPPAVGHARGNVNGHNTAAATPPGAQKSGLDRYESLL